MKLDRQRTDRTNDSTWIRILMESLLVSLSKVRAADSRSDGRPVSLLDVLRQISHASACPLLSQSSHMLFGANTVNVSFLLQEPRVSRDSIPESPAFDLTGEHAPHVVFNPRRDFERPYAFQ